MTNPLKTPQAHSIALLLARVPLGVFFLIAGYVKVARVGIKPFEEAHKNDAARFLSPQLAGLFLQSLPFVEMLVGVALIVGFFTRVAASITSLLLLSFIIAITGIAFDASGARPPMADNVVFLGLSILLMTTGGGEMTVDHTFHKAPPGPPKK